MVAPCQIPEPLRPGDRLWAIAPSGAVRNLEAMEQGLAIWRSQGYQVDLAPGYDQQWGYLAGDDSHRRQQLHCAWTDPNYRGILCIRGGYGATRLLEDWSWQRMGQELSLKWLIGFSDITALLWSLCRAGVSGVHGPVLTTLGQEPDWSRDRLFRWVAGDRALPVLIGQGWGVGKASGWLLPGNLAVGTHLLGTPLQPDLTGAILAFEDVGEVPYRVDRLLTQWRMMGILDQVSGIALGRFSQSEPRSNSSSLSMAEVFCDRLGGLGIPIVSNLAFGHDGPNAALPVGVPAFLDSDAGTLKIGTDE